MARIFLSYSRKSQDVTRSVVDDLRALGHTVWFDEDLAGGQAWWDHILTRIRESDLFVFILDQKSLSSVPCQRECNYAADLGKSILPILVEDGISLNLLRPALAKTQFVDYRMQDRQAALRLGRALTAIPPPKPLPDPLPTPPEVPISYLGRLGQEIETPGTLSYEKQSALVVDLKSGLRDPQAAGDARALLERLRGRHDLYAKIAAEIDELIGSTRNGASPSPNGTEAEASRAEPGSDQASDWTESEAGTGKEKPKPAQQGSKVLIGVTASIVVIGLILSSIPGKEPPAPPKEAPATPAPAQPATAPPKAGETSRDCDECPEMVVIPAGQFVMGSPSTALDIDKDEGPQHAVTIPRPFGVGKYPVMRGQYRLFAQETGRTDGDGCWGWNAKIKNWEKDITRNWRGPGFEQGDDYPVVCVSWGDAKAYVEWLGGRTGKPYRLLSEAEAEYTIRAGNSASQPWGDDPAQACLYANVADRTARDRIAGSKNFNIHDCSDGYAYTSPVGNYVANAFGLHDMIGNVWEWTEDCYHDSYSGAPTDGSAWTSGPCELRVLRGGGWSDDPHSARSANRVSFNPGDRSFYQGFRVARTLP